jgi:hypothetical protein
MDAIEGPAACLREIRGDLEIVEGVIPALDEIFSSDKGVQPHGHERSRKP